MNDWMQRCYTRLLIDNHISEDDPAFMTRFDPQHYASIHSNPPGAFTGYAGLAIHSFGKGRCIYLAPDVFHLQQDAQQTFAAWLLRSCAPGGYQCAAGGGDQPAAQYHAGCHTGWVGELPERASQYPCAGNPGRACPGWPHPQGVYACLEWPGLAFHPGEWRKR